MLKRNFYCEVKVPKGNYISEIGRLAKRKLRSRKADCTSKKTAPFYPICSFLYSDSMCKIRTHFPAIELNYS